MSCAKRCLWRNLVLGLNQTARVVLSRYVTEPDIVRQRAEQRNSVSDKHDADGPPDPSAQPVTNYYTSNRFECCSGVSE